MQRRRIIGLRASLFRRGANADGRRGRIAPRKLLLIGQVAAATVLLISTGLFIRTLQALNAQDLGFNRDHLLLVWALPGPTGRQGTAAEMLWTDVQERLSAIPGVSSVAISVEGLLAGGPVGGPLVDVDGAAQTTNGLRVEATMTVGPRFFETVGQRVVQGREFTYADGRTRRLLSL